MRFKIDKLFYIILTIAIVFLVFSLQLFAQTLRYSNHRDLSIPDYATLHLGPFFSDISFMQSAGYRYVRSSGVGVDFLKNNKRGIYKEDGYDFPLISRLNFRNYLLISQRMDMDLSISVNYEHYPRHTQEDVFAIILPEEGILGDLSFMFQPTPFAKITLYDNFVYKTDYIDTRGITDLYGGSEYEYFKNTVGLDSDWLIAEDQNVGISLSQTDNMPKDDSFKMQEYVSYAESILYEKRITSFLITGAKASFSQAYYAVSNRPNASAGEYLIYSKVQLTQQTEGGGSIGYSEIFAGAEDNDGETIVGDIFLKTRLTENVSHMLSYKHKRQMGFAVNFETTDVLSYELGMRKHDSSLLFVVSHGRNDPNNVLWNGYDNTHLGLDFSFPLVVSILKLNGGLSYDMRDNETPLADMSEIEMIADYNTLIAYLGTGIKIMNNLDFSVSFRHISRDSEMMELEYKRDVFSAELVYAKYF